MKPLTIGALASRAGVGVETIRFYERKGLVRRPPRPGTGFRLYPEETVARIRFIRQAQTLGFTLQEIRGLLALRVAPGTDCAAVRSRAVAKLANVEARLEELERIQGALAKLIAACPGRGADHDLHDPRGAR
jgi:MerR family mercuric resistance operon transcriptional regulator